MTTIATANPIPETLAPKIGTVVGAYRLKEPYIHHDASFETASWWEDSRLEPGIYPLHVGQMTYGRSKPLIVYAEGIGTVVDAYFASSFGGNPFGGSNKEHHVGKTKKVRISTELQRAIEQTGTSPSDSQPDIWINPEFWPGFKEYAQARYKKTLKGFEDRYRNDSEIEQIRTTKFHAGWIEEDAKLLEAILGKIQSWEKHTPMMAETIRKNTEWATQWASQFIPQSHS